MADDAELSAEISAAAEDAQIIRKRGPAKGSEKARLIAQIAANTRWGREPNRTAATQAMRDGLRAKHRREVLAENPGLTDEAEIERRIGSKMKAQLARGQKNSLDTRQTRAAAREQAKADALADALLAARMADRDALCPECDAGVHRKCSGIAMASGPCLCMHSAIAPGSLTDEPAAQAELGIAEDEVA